MTLTRMAVMAAETPSPLMSGFSKLVLAGTIACALLAVGLVVAVVLLSHPVDGKEELPVRGSQSVLANNAVWHARINDIVAQYDQGDIDRDEAFTRLASVTRDFASIAFNRNMGSHTLADLQHVPRIPSNQRGLDLLRQTIAALYPLEFADADYHDMARDTSVGQAADWVSALVERWQ